LTSVQEPQSRTGDKLCGRVAVLDVNPVNAVTPGYIATDMVSSIPAKVLDGLRAEFPVGRPGQPDEIARVVHFLAADASAYVTGRLRRQRRTGHVAQSPGGE
jgi:hypothetical protein